MKIFLREGQLPNSKGGIYNPGVSAHSLAENERHILVRVEKHHQYHNDSSEALIIDKVEKLREGEVDGIYYPKRVGFGSNCKIEDFRLFYFREQLYAIHTLVITERGSEDATTIKPVISKISRHSIELWDWCDLPYVPRKIGEKNWLPVVYNDELYIVYSLDPLRIFKLDGWSWKEVIFQETGLASHVKKLKPKSHYLSLSAITHFRGDQFIGFYHYRDVNYEQGLFILNMKTLKIEHFTPPILSGGGLDGHRPDVLYVSGLIATPTLLEVYCGIADSHTALIELPMEEVNNVLGAHPWTYTAPLRVLFKDRGIGDFICMSYALMGWMKETGRGIKLYTSINLELASAMKLPGVKVIKWSGEPVDVDLSSNEDSLPEDMRKEYQEKIKGSLKEWYAKKLKSKLASPPMEHILPLKGYEDAIVLFPFAAHEMRSWPLKNWIELATRLLTSGRKVIIADKFPERCKDLPGEKMVGISLWEQFRLVRTAKVVVANESGGAHMAGLFDTKTLVLSGWLDPAVVNDHTNNDFIYKKPIQSISVDEVYNKIISYI